jgi:hypothetical protein
MAVVANVVLMTVGLVDAGIGGQWGLFVLFAIGHGLALLYCAEGHRSLCHPRPSLGETHGPS